MSDTQNTNPEEITEVVSVESVEASTPVEAVSQTPSEKPARGGRPERSGNDRPRGPRRDGMREEEKEFKEEMLSIDRVTRVTA